MISNRPWIALFSHTGSEVVSISRKLGFQPDLIVTNNTESKIAAKHVVSTASKPTVHDYRTIFNLVDDHPIITLHGWMRIIPDPICKEYDIFNLHPGLITEYPELKGKDPQEKVFSMMEPPQHVGCVIHKAVGEVDSGPVIMSRRVYNTYPSISMLTDVLHEMAGGMWIDFIEKQLYDESNI
jgi:folate-dependent phosphoribosylglycinamide formyltransferase PurN